MSLALEYPQTGTSIELLQQTPVMKHFITLLEKIEDTNTNNTRTDESIVKSEIITPTAEDLLFWKICQQ